MIGRMSEKSFELNCEYRPSGDQPQAIEKLTAGLNADMPIVEMAITGLRLLFVLTSRYDAAIIAILF